VRLRICVRDVELATARVVAGAFALVFRITDGVASRLLVAVVSVGAPLELRRLPEGILVAGFGVVLESPDGSFSLLFGWFIGVFTDLAGSERSDIGGDGGVGVSETVSAVETDLVSGGVVIMGEEAVELKEFSGSKAGEFGAVISVASVGS
jgi:hypothetical protein